MESADLLHACEGFQWDAGNWDKNWRKHRVAAYECEQVFFNQPLIVRSEEPAGKKDPDFYALGQTDEGRWRFIAFIVRSRQIRVVSARDMTPRERKEYLSL
jgi:uncharacterized protein